MSLFEFSACVAGFNRANGGASASKPATEITDDQYDALCELGERWSNEAK